MNPILSSPIPPSIFAKLIREGFPDVWKHYNLNEQFLRRNISHKLDSILKKDERLSYIQKLIDSILEEIEASELLKSIYLSSRHGAYQIIEATKGDIFSKATRLLDDPEIIETVNHLNNDLDKLIELANGALLPASDDNDVEFGSMMNVMNQSMRRVGSNLEELKSDYPNQYNAVEILNNATQGNPIRLNSHIVYGYFLNNRIEWLKNLSTALKSSEDNFAIGSFKMMSNFALIEGEMTYAQFFRALNFLCEDEHSGKALMKKDDVEALKEAISIANKLGEYHGRKFRIIKGSGQKRRFYNFIFELWYTHTYDLNNGQKAFAMFINMFFDGFPRIESILGQIVENTKEDWKKKIRKYILPRNDIHS